MAKVSIHDLAADDRPRERLMSLGAGVLTDAELLAILIGSGSTDESAVSLMQNVLRDVDHNLKRLGRLSIEELCRYKGIGPAKAVTIMAACELGRRRSELGPDLREQLTDSAALYRFFSPKMQDLPTEEFHAVFLNNALRVIGSAVISKGGIASSLVDIRCLMREALLARAVAMAVCHNHPAGTLQPSTSDDALTKQIGDACRFLKIRLIDHLIYVDGNYYSYADAGRL